MEESRERFTANNADIGAAGSFAALKVFFSLIGAICGVGETAALGRMGRLAPAAILAAVFAAPGAYLLRCRKPLAVFALCACAVAALTGLILAAALPLRSGALLIGFALARPEASAGGLALMAALDVFLTALSAALTELSLQSELLLQADRLGLLTTQRR